MPRLVQRSAVASLPVGPNRTEPESTLRASKPSDESRATGMTPLDFGSMRAMRSTPGLMSIPIGSTDGGAGGCTTGGCTTGAEIPEMINVYRPFDKLLLMKAVALPSSRNVRGTVWKTPPLVTPTVYVPVAGSTIPSRRASRYIGGLELGMGIEPSSPLPASSEGRKKRGVSAVVGGGPQMPMIVSRLRSPSGLVALNAAPLKPKSISMVTALPAYPWKE